mgnify:FL=1
MITQEDISKIMVENKQRVPVTKHDTAVFIVDIPKVSKLILEFLKKKKL